MPMAAWTYGLEDRLLLVLLALCGHAFLVAPQLVVMHWRIPAFHIPLIRFIHALQEKLNRKKRSEESRRFRGMLLVAVLVALSLYIGYELKRWVALHQGGYLLEWLLIMLLVPVDRLLGKTVRASRIIAKGNLDEARQAVREIARRNIGQLDEPAILRASIEALVKNFADHVVSPLLWYMLLGLPGLIAARAINLLDHELGRRSSQYASFGWAAAKLDDLVQWIPARMAGVLVALAGGFVPGGNLARAFKITLRDAGRMVSPNSGWPISAAAGALGITLGGPRSYHMAYIEDPWVGEGTVKASLLHLRRALYLYAVACLLLVFVVLLLLYGGVA